MFHGYHTTSSFTTTASVLRHCGTDVPTAEPSSYYNKLSEWHNPTLFSDDELVAHSHLSHPPTSNVDRGLGFNFYDDQLWSVDLDSPASAVPYTSGPCSVYQYACPPSTADAQFIPTLVSVFPMEVLTMPTPTVFPRTHSAIKDPIHHRPVVQNVHRMESCRVPAKAFGYPSVLEPAAWQKLAASQCVASSTTPDWMQSSSPVRVLNGEDDERHPSRPTQTKSSPRADQSSAPASEAPLQSVGGRTAHMKLRITSYTPSRTRRIATRMSLSPCTSITSSASSYSHTSRGNTPSKGFSPSPSSPSTPPPQATESASQLPSSSNPPLRESTVPPSPAPASRSTRPSLICPHCPPSKAHEFGRPLDLERHITSIHRSSPNAWVCCGIPLEVAKERPDIPPHVLAEQPREYNGIQMVGGCGTPNSRKDVLRRHLRRNAGRCFGDENAAYLLGNQARVRSVRGTRSKDTQGVRAPLGEGAAGESGKGERSDRD